MTESKQTTEQWEADKIIVNYAYVPVDWQAFYQFGGDLVRLEDGKVYFRVEKRVGG